MVFDVEEGDIRRFAQAVGDSNPLWQDRQFAAKTSYGGIIAPPTFVASLSPYDFLGQIIAQSPYKRQINGGNELELIQPIRPGDRITAILKVNDVRERKGKFGDTAIMSAETTYTNQNNQTVATVKTTILFYQEAADALL